MKMILRIARTELATIFFSPIGWLILVVFVFQTGLQFTDHLENLQTAQQIGNKLSALTFQTFIFRMSGGILPQLQYNLYLYVPLLTMGVISRELSSGSIKLLQSSPVKIREMVLGKFLAMMGYGFLLILSVFLYALAAKLYIKDFDLSWVLSGLLGLYCLLCAYAAIGIFMSSLTSYQVVAAICTLIVFALLGYVGALWQEIDFVRDLTYFLSISGRADKMVAGLITSKDLFYFIIVIALFLGFTMLRLQSGRETRPFHIKALRYLGLTACCLLAGYCTSRPALIGYIDLSSNKGLTLSDASREVVRQVKGPLRITTYVNLLDGFYNYGAPDQRNNDLQRFEQYLRFMPDLEMDYVYYYDTSLNKYLFNNKKNKGRPVPEVARSYAESRRIDLGDFLMPQQMKQRIDLGPEQYRFVRKLEAGGKSTWLRVFDDMERFPGEMEITAALKRLVVPKVPVIAFLTGNNERSIRKQGDRDYEGAANRPGFRYSLINQGFDVREVSLKDSSLPADIAVLVVADPRMPFSAPELEQIAGYIDAGGHLLLITEPGKQPALQPLFDKIGVQFVPGNLVRTSQNDAPDFIRAVLPAEAAGLDSLFAKVAQDTAKRVVMSGVAAMQAAASTAFTVRPLLQADTAGTWLKVGTLSQDSLNIHFNEAAGDRRGIYSTALALTRQVNGATQKIVVIGDGDFMSNMELSLRSSLSSSNFRFMNGLFSWYSHGEFPVTISRESTTDTAVLVGRQGVVTAKVLFLGLLPGLLAIYGTILLIRRKSR